MVQLKRSSKKIIKKPVSTSSKAPVKKTTSGFKRRNAELKASGSGVTGFAGAKGFRQAKTEKKISDENRKKRQLPWRMWIRPGESAKVVLLDKEPFFMYEHDLGKDASGNKVFERCIKETGHCPLCSKTGREGYYVMMCTALDLRGYKPKPGSKSKPQRVVKRLFPVKQAQMPKFQRIYEANGNSFQGIKLNCVRDGEKDSVIGNDIEKIGKMSSVDIKKYGDDLIKVVDYEDAFKMLTEDEMKKRYGVKSVMGSSDFNDDSDDEDDDSDSDDWGDDD